MFELQTSPREITNAHSYSSNASMKGDNSALAVTMCYQLSFKLGLCCFSVCPLICGQGAVYRGDDLADLRECFAL